MSTNKRSIRISAGQAVYLRDLVRDDLAETDLNSDEVSQATSLLAQTEDVLTRWGMS